MGDRANIVIIDKDLEKKHGSFPHPLFLYTHWSGSEIKDTLKASLQRGRDRWHDGQYLARIVFQDLIDEDEGLTGFGLSTRIGDGEHNLLLLHTDTNTVEEIDSVKDHTAKVLKTWTFEEFAAADFSDAEDDEE